MNYSHIVVQERGIRLGVSGKCLSIKGENKENKIPFNRIRMITIQTKAISLSSDLVFELSKRGIGVHFSIYEVSSTLYSYSGHQSVKIREKQYELNREENLPRRVSLAIKIIRGKIQNQRAVLKYFEKYSKNKSAKLEGGEDSISSSSLEGQDIPIYTSLSAFKQGIEGIDKTLERLKKLSEENKKEVEENWLNKLMGEEGKAASFYFKALKDAFFLEKEFGFKTREQRGANNIINQALNYGYALLQSTIWDSVTKAGLEPYYGFIHTPRSGKPSLILDLMEVFRPWVVERNIIKLRNRFRGKDELDRSLKKDISKEILTTLKKKYLYKKKRTALYTIIQREIYRLSGEIYGEEKKFKPYIFKW